MGVWSQCGDVLIRASDANAAADAAVALPLPSGRKNLCTDESLGLDVGDCDVWVEIFDSMGGSNWPSTWRQGCKGDLRTNPCGCNGFWQKKVRCTAKRDLQRITEIYMLGQSVSGHIPSSIAKLDELVALSLVGTNLMGSLPAEMGSMSNLEMVWLDRNR